MKQIKKWSQGKDPFIVGMSLLIAGFANEYLELSKIHRKGKRLEGDIHLPKLKTWNNLYHNDKRVVKELISAFGLEKISKNQKENLENVLLKSEVLKKKLFSMISKSEEGFSEEEFKIIEEFKNEAIENFTCEIEEKEREIFLEKLTKPGIIFALRVTIPCLTFYKIMPSQLIKKAEGGDDVALEQLIRLDKSVIFNPKISEIIHQAQALKRQERMSMIRKAFISKPKAPLKMSTIKFQLGGLISYFSILTNCKLSAKDIRNMYDAIAQDMNIDAIDPDFGSMGSETFAKNIQDYRNIWQNLILGGKKII